MKIKHKNKKKKASHHCRFCGQITADDDKNCFFASKFQNSCAAEKKLNP